MAQAAPESLLPPGFDDPAPAPTGTAKPAPRPAPRPAPSATPAGRPAATSGTSSSVVQPLPSGDGATAPAPASGGSISRLPTLDELENLDADELDELLGLKPKFDIPPASRRSMERVGVLAASEGGLPSQALARQPASIVRASLGGIKGPMVSRWGHIMLRRALVSRLAAPEGMNPVEFATLRVKALNQLGEHSAARAVAQDVDSGNWDLNLSNAALDAFIGTSDLVGACPVSQIKGRSLEGIRWQLVRDICFAFAGQSGRAQENLNKAFRDKDASQIDVLLAQRFAGAAGGGRRAINLEWDGVTELTAWRFAIANAVGAELPEALLKDAGPYFQNIAATAPMLPLAQRAEGATIAAGRGVMSSSAMVDLYSQIYAQGEGAGGESLTASNLRAAYVATDPAARVKAINDVWGATQTDYSRYVLTAYAAARITPSEDLADNAPKLLASMLTAGLDADALSWAQIVPQGSQGWALLALAQPQRPSPVTGSQLSTFIGDDDSEGQRKSQFLLAGLAGLGRIDDATQASASSDLGVDLSRGTKWSQLIDSAAQVNNPALVAYLAGVGMQGSGWDKMTARHLYHIVSALNRVGMSAEARMIAAEAVARG
ncbi:hypothetical protein GRI36_09980 [Altererythrobacter gangjinensis]|uniref:Uncharacterized protein n=2 Tax=Pontixanthobacter gangjinensis TaxID=1028742 RepID=A0A6I4SPX9_9SPHN|nr:hypothetical protein [Pontixanthobacter gangjinensis]